jgi:hypothetical protein
VGDVPFVHLNSAWQTFLKKKRLGYSLRKFTIPGKLDNRSGQPKWSTPSGRRVGYTSGTRSSSRVPLALAKAEIQAGATM